MGIEGVGVSGSRRGRGGSIASELVHIYISLGAYIASFENKGIEN